MVGVANKPGLSGHQTFDNSRENEGLRQAVDNLEADVAALEAAGGESFVGQGVLAAGASTTQLVVVPIPEGINTAFSVVATLVAVTANPSYARQTIEILVSRDSQGGLVDSTFNLPTAFDLGGASVSFSSPGIIQTGASTFALQIAGNNQDGVNQAEFCIRATVDLTCVLETVDIPAA